MSAEEPARLDRVALDADDAAIEQARVSGEDGQLAAGLRDWVANS